nr:MAG TPA: RNA polymerase sigma factor [Caudoviricetes sp.]
MNQKQKDRIAALRVEGVSYGKIADRLGLSINTVKSYCKRSLTETKADASPQKEHAKDTCLHCGQTLIQTPGHRQKKFCSASCRRNWWLNHPGVTTRSAEHDCTCFFCGRTFRYYGNQPRKYCSRTCYQKQRIAQGGDRRE